MEPEGPCIQEPENGHYCELDNLINALVLSSLHAYISIKVFGLKLYKHFHLSETSAGVGGIASGANTILRFYL
jgi:hypothetical protein